MMMSDLTLVTDVGSDGLRLRAMCSSLIASPYNPWRARAWVKRTEGVREWKREKKG